MRRGLVVLQSLLMLHPSSSPAITASAIPIRSCSSSSSSASSSPSHLRLARASTTSASMATTPQDQKKALRSEIRKALRALSPAQRAQQDSAIQSMILSSSWFRSSDRLCAYISCPALREVDTSTILSQLLAKPDSEHQVLTQKELYVPRIEDKNSNMRMLKITTMDDLVPNSMNILEPSPLDEKGMQREDVMSATNPVDLFLLPGVAFDKQGRRLGRGGGYYDVLLKKYQDLALEKKWNKPLLVALAYSVQIKEEGIIPVTPTDMPIDAIVSSDGVIPISPLAKEKMS